MILSKLIVSIDEHKNKLDYVFAKKITDLTYQPKHISCIDLERLRKLHEKVQKIKKFQLQVLSDSHIEIPSEILEALELEIGDKIIATISENKILIMGADRMKKGLFEEIDEIPYDDEELSKKELKLIKKAIKQCDKGKTVSWEELIKNDKIWE